VRGNGRTGGGPDDDRRRPGTDDVEAAVTFVVAAEPASLHGLRRDVVEFVLGSGGDRTDAETIELATSELATNVIQHTQATTIDVRVETTPEQWVLVVDDAQDLELGGPMTAPPVTSATGRGLFVVQQLMDDLDVTTLDGRRVLRCTKRRR
jgi:anti-sigma regulatory factor (Ser/Thr protein kinase)